jgi:amidase
MDLKGAMAMAPSFDAGGWFASSPGPFRLAGDVLLKDHVLGDLTRAVLLEDAFENADSAVSDLCRHFIAGAAAALPPIEAAKIAGSSIDRWREAMRITQAFEVWETFGPYLTQARPQHGPGVAERMAIAAAVTSEQRDSSRGILNEAQERIETLTAPGTVLILPTAPSIAPLLTANAEELERYRIGVMRLVCVGSISGLPQITVPIGTLSGAPVGLSFIGWRNSDKALLALAQKLAPHIGLAAK